MLGDVENQIGGGPHYCRMSLLNVSPIHKRINHGYFVRSSAPSHQKRHQREQGERQEIDGARYRISTRKEFGQGLPNEQGVQPKLSRDEQAQSKQPHSYAV